MSMELQIPETVVQAIRLPEERIVPELLVELAVGLYAQGLLSFGKARALAKKEKFEFGRLLGERGIKRHYDKEEMEDDLAYANSK